MKMRKIMMILAAALLCSLANAQTSGYYTRPNIFGDTTIRYNNGLQGTLSRPDIFGGQTLRYNNGTTYQYQAPNVFGERHFQIQTMPRRTYGYGY